MYSKVQNFLKRALVVLLCTVMLCNSILAASSAKESDTILGSKKALGSPILNNNFTIDNWNKWEMICWGVFLSNFCIPLIDTYETCFSTVGGGSRGTGYKALVFGSGNDRTNNEVIKKLVTYASAVQRSTAIPIYVGYMRIDKGLPEPSTFKDPNLTDDAVRVATMRDFFFVNDEDTSVEIGNTFGVCGKSGGWPYAFKNSKDYQKIGRIEKGNIPIFYIKNNDGKYVEVLNFTNAWDVQMMAAIINRVKNGNTGDGESYSSLFGAAFDKYWDSNTAVALDAFGNITVDNRILFPASANRNLTTNGDMNLMNSFVLNSYATTYSEKQLILEAKQNVESTISWWDNCVDRRGGYPALGEANLGGAGFLYYDTDQIQCQNGIESGDVLEYGKLMTELFDCDPSADNCKYNLKFEISGNGVTKTREGFLGLKYAPDAIENTYFVASMLANVTPSGGSGSKTLSYMVDMYGNKVPLFNNKGVVTPVQLLKGTNKEPTAQGAVRNFYNFLYKVYVGDTGTGSGEAKLSRSTLQSELPTMSFKDFKSSTHKLFGSNKDSWWSAFQNANPTYKGEKFRLQLFDLNDNNSLTSEANRLILLFPISDHMKAISQVFAVKDGMEFAMYSTMIYMTYLEFYGVTRQTTLTGATNDSSNFNKEIYDERTNNALNADGSDLGDSTSADEMQEEVARMSYLVLHPENGREYRMSLLRNTLSDWIVEQYQRIVFGGQLNDTFSGSTSKSNSGFLHIPTYTDNILTSWILDLYVDIATYLIMGLAIAIVILGLLKSKKISWYFVSLVVAINAVLLIPSSGEIVPYVTSNIIQKMFSEKMTFWSMSQGIYNAKLEANSKSSDGYLSKLTDEDATAVTAIIKQLSVIYTDRSLMVKQDISQKLTQAVQGSYTEIQSLQSARWILPMVMQQFTGETDEADYIYKPIANIWDDMSNMFWFFKPDDAVQTEIQAKTTTSGQTDCPVASIGYSDVSTYFEDKVDSDYKVDTEMNYKCFSYSIHGDLEEQVHLKSTYLPDTSRVAYGNLFGDFKDYKNADSWKEYIETSKGKASKTNWESTRAGGFEDTADAYNRTERSSITEDMPYLLSTETPSYYFYNTVKDSFDDLISVAAIFGQLQGQIEENEDDKEVRSNFMYATLGPDEAVNMGTDKLNYTGYIRDVLDLQELFSNVVPYLYEMQLIAGGFDNVSGVLEDEVITEELRYYKGIEQGWLYRCNWATKLMQNPEYSEPTMVKDKDGQRYTVNCPVMPASYPDERPMVFSEAQKIAMGLKDSDLNIVELKCIEANKKIARQWTLMVNYAGTGGVTREVLMRQMATDATLIFCDEFSSSGVLNTMYTMYPQSLDLRYLSFDSMMKMLVLNVTKNTSYIYSDTMSTLIEDTDIATSFMLLLCALCCAYIVPFVIQVTMAVIFIMGFLAVVRSILSSNGYKAKVACGQFITNMSFLIITIMYYAMFRGLVAVNSSDDVLTVKRIEVHAGAPIIAFIIILIATVCYIRAMWVIIVDICFKKNSDMGFEYYSMLASSMTGRINSALEAISGRAGSVMNTLFNSEENNANKTNSTTNTKSIKGTGAKDAPVTDVNIKKAGRGTIEVKQDDDMKDNIFMEADYNGNYNKLDDVAAQDKELAADIDKQIEVGSNMKDTQVVVDDRK